jgi:hypothetical protein
MTKEGEFADFAPSHFGVVKRGRGFFWCHESGQSAAAIREGVY